MLYLNETVVVGFIQLVQEATWLSPIVMVPKKNGKLWIYVNFHKLNATTKTNPYPLHLLMKYSTPWLDMKHTHSWMVILGIIKYPLHLMIATKLFA
jgi:hypothetical protein